MPTSDRITITAAARDIFSVAPETAWRWTLRGVRGVKLQSFVVGGRRFTTRDACDRFLAALNGATSPEPVPTAVQSRADAAAQALDRAGI